MESGKVNRSSRFPFGTIWPKIARTVLMQWYPTKFDHAKNLGTCCSSGDRTGESPQTAQTSLPGPTGEMRSSDPFCLVLRLLDGRTVDDAHAHTPDRLGSRGSIRELDTVPRAPTASEAPYSSSKL